MTLCQRKRQQMYGNVHRPQWYYIIGYTAPLLCAIVFWMLRDTTPVVFVTPSLSDMHLDRGDVVNSDKINDVYWRVSIRHVSSLLSEVCQKDNYTVLTHKNIMMDSVRMKESYIYVCDGAVHSVLNARSVVSAAAVKTVRCVETYANVTKTIVRKYPFSLKYVCGATFVSKTRIIREPMEACLWLHAIDIVESVWD
tara:strand:- start:595 stop:1182 length:588 start_codon:yes stop_codon:yes gene_type:complete